jgi:hypothetical protein
MKSHSVQTPGTVCRVHVEHLQQLLFLSVYIFYHFVYKFVVASLLLFLLLLGQSRHRDDSWM